MARTRRYEVSGALSHIMARGIDGCPIFGDDKDRTAFVGRLGQALARTGFRCVAWVLMNTHYHLVVRSAGGLRLNALMRPLNGGYARWYNHRHGRRGYLFQDRFRSIVCQDLGYARELVRYVHLNPVRAGYVKDLAALGRYRWCGHRALLGDKSGCQWQHTDEVLRRFGDRRSDAVKNYLAFLQQGLDQEGEELAVFRGEEETPLPGVVGDRTFVVAAAEAERKRVAVAERLRAQGWTLERLAAHVAACCGLEAEKVRSPGRANQRSRARALIAYVAHRQMRVPTTEIARLLGVGQPAVSRAIRRCEENGMGSDLERILAAMDGDE